MAELTFVEAGTVNEFTNNDDDIVERAVTIVIKLVNIRLVPLNIVVVPEKFNISIWVFEVTTCHDIRRYS